MKKDTLDYIFEGCKAGNRKAQNALYEQYAPLMFSICKQYTRNYDDANDVHIEAFMKIFQNINLCRNKDAFVGWMKRIVINHAINYYRRLKKQQYLDDIDEVNELNILDVDGYISNDYPIVSAEKLLALIKRLPDGYQKVFNLFVMEKYSHKEISKMLHITENTSKTQYFKARRMLRNNLNNMNIMMPIHE